MLYVFFVAVLILIISIIMLIYFSFINKKTNPNINKIMTICIMLALMVIAFLIEPKETNDLYRHFSWIDRFRISGFFGVSEYDDVIGAKILFYLISFLPSNHFLPVIAILITYGMFFYIINNFAKEHKLNSRIVAISIFLGFSICDFSSTISGVRNTMAFAFLALSLYKDLIKNEKGIKIILPYLIAVSIHPSSWIVVVARLILKLKYNEKLKYILLFWSVAVNYIIKILLNISPYIASKLQMYVTEEDDVSDFRMVFIKIIFIIFLYVITILFKKFKDIDYKKYINFLQLYFCIMIGSIFASTIMFGRLYFLIGFLLIPLIYLIDKKLTINKKIIIYIILVIFIVGSLAYSVVQIRGNMDFVFYMLN